MWYKLKKIQSKWCRTFTYNAPCDSNWITYGRQFDGALSWFGQPCLNGDGSYAR
jgi:hypothetical protein